MSAGGGTPTGRPAHERECWCDECEAWRLGRPVGAPTSDLLDRIEEAGPDYMGLVRMPKEMRDALIAVARAARGVMTQMDYETPHHTRLREALARLDGAR